MSNEITETQVERLPVGGEVDMQIATARQYPRDVKACIQETVAMATMDQETAQECFYLLPRGEKKIPGPSVRLAEIAVNSWGNVRAESRVVEQTNTHVVAEGVCWDLEKNTAAKVSVTRKIQGKTPAKRANMAEVTAQAACAIAYRNAVFKIIPAALTKKAYNAAVKAAVGDANERDATISAMLKFYANIGYDEEAVLRYCGAEDITGLTDDHIVMLRGIANAIRSGEQDKRYALGGEPEASEAFSINDEEASSDA